MPERSLERASPLQPQFDMQNRLLAGLVVALETGIELSTLDELTQLPNRRAMLDILPVVLDSGIGKTKRRRETDHLIKPALHVPNCFAMLDIDNFKRVNDQCGHDAGDQVLIATAGILQTRKRVKDYAARWGGEEFAVLMPDTTLNNAIKAANKLRRAVKEEGLPTVSIGVGQLRSYGNLSADIACVDRALYQAKHRGKDKVVAADVR